MGQRGRRKRKQARGGTAPRRGDGDELSARYRARSEARNEAARARLEPLAPGERPVAVTVGAAIAFALGLVNMIFYLAGGEIGGDRPAVAGVLSYSALMFVAAFGQWRARYWAVLGMEALLGILVVIFALLGVFAQNVLAVVVSVVVVGAAGALFWFLVKAMARIQMPERL